MDPTLHVAVQAHRRVSKRGKIERIRAHLRLKPRPHQRR